MSALRWVARRVALRRTLQPHCLQSAAVATTSRLCQQANEQEEKALKVKTTDAIPSSPFVRPPILKPDLAAQTPVEDQSTLRGISVNKFHKVR